MLELPWNFAAIPQYFLRFFPAALMTLQITTLGIGIGLLLGFIAGLMRTSTYKIFNIPSYLYIWIIRGTPLLLQLFIIYYGLAVIVSIPRFPAAVLALGVHNGAYIAEIFRGAIQSIDRGQKEAALSLGMTEWQTMHRIILPQAFKRAIPPLGNQFIIALKDSSLASTIAVKELLLRTRQVGSSQFMMMEMLIIAATYYLILTSILTLITTRIEKNLSISDRRN
jgi:polar amino acid transport system permease protein